MLGVWAALSLTLADQALAAVMEYLMPEAKHEGANFVRRRLAAVPLDLEEARSLRGSGWDGDLVDMRTDRVRRR